MAASAARRSRPSYTSNDMDPLVQEMAKNPHPMNPTTSNPFERAASGSNASDASSIQSIPATAAKNNDSGATHARGASFEVADPLPEEVESEIMRADAENAQIRDSLFHISTGHKSLKSADLTSDDGVESHSAADGDVQERMINHTELEPIDSDQSDDSLTASDKRRSARDSMIMEDLLDISKKAIKDRAGTNEDTNGNSGDNGKESVSNEVGAKRRASRQIESRFDTSGTGSISNLHAGRLSTDTLGNGGASGAASGNRSRRDSIDRAIERDHESYVTERKLEQKWTHARKASTNIVRQKSQKMVNRMEQEEDPLASAAFEIQYDSSGSDAEIIDMDDINGADAEDGAIAEDMINVARRDRKPSINTALNNLESAGELEQEINFSLAKEKGFKHARKQSTQIAKQQSGKTTKDRVDVQRNYVVSIDEISSGAPQEDDEEDLDPEEIFATPYQSGSEEDVADYKMGPSGDETNETSELNENSSSGTLGVNVANGANGANGGQQNSKQRRVSKVIDSNPNFKNENDARIEAGLAHQKQLTRYQKSHASRTFSGEDVKKIKDRTAGGNKGIKDIHDMNGDFTERGRILDDGVSGSSSGSESSEDPDIKIVSRNNKTRGSRVIREMEIKQLAKITGAHRREESLNDAYMNAFGNDDSVAPIASVLAGFMAAAADSAPPLPPITPVGLDGTREEKDAPNEGMQSVEAWVTEAIDLEVKELRELRQEVARLRKEDEKKSKQLEEMEELKRKLDEMYGLERRNHSLQKKCERLETENKALGEEMVKINNEYHNEIEKLRGEYKDVVTAKIESMKQMAKEFDLMRAAIKIYNR